MLTPMPPSTLLQWTVVERDHLIAHDPSAAEGIPTGQEDVL
jgi:hypothetical protein